MKSFKEKMPQIDTFIFDMDGVLTDGQVFLYKDEILRNLFSKDGYAIQFAKKKGYRLFVISGGYSEDMKTKLEGLGMTEVVLNANNKITAFATLKTKHGLKVENCLYMGDDIPDLPLLEKVGLSTCPSDASPELRMSVDYISPKNGGRGCVRDVIEQVMRVRGDWMSEGALEW